MSYFLKKSRIKKGVYLQIYEGHYDPNKGRAVNTSCRAIGYVDELIGRGIADPVSHFCILSTIFPIIIKWNSKIFHFENYRIFF